VQLYTFILSHYSEKVRWLLDASQTVYRETALTPFLHIPRTLWLGGGRATSVPILKVGRTNIQGSGRILKWLAANRAPCRLLPEEADARAKILDIEKRFDHVGRHVIRYVYSDALNDRSGVPRLWTAASGPLPRALVRTSFPLLRRVTRRAFAITTVNAEASREAIGSVLLWLEEQIADGRRHLVGSELSAADIGACAILAPLACPAEHPIYSRDDYRVLMRRQVEPFSSRPALQWVRETYRREREFGSSRINLVKVRSR
jgi:glutathione S-transferase